MMSRRIVFVVLALAGCVGAPPTASVEEGVRVCAAGAVVKGVDVSHYDGAIDWKKAHAAGIDFTIIKATESTGYLDPQFATNWKDSHANGVIRGAYHFFHPSVDPVAQADYFLSVMGPSVAGDLPPTLDLETLDNLTAAQTTQAALQFLQRLQQKTGRVPIVYTSARVMGLLNNPQGFTSYALWDANWTTLCPDLPPEWASWTFWQNSDTGVVDGINSSELDTDEFNGTLSDLVAYAGGGSGGSDGGSGDGGSGDGGSGDGGIVPADAGDTGDGGAADDGGDTDGDVGAPPDLARGPGHGAGCSIAPGDTGDASAVVFLLFFVVLAGGVPLVCRLRHTARAS